MKGELSTPRTELEPLSERAQCSQRPPHLNSLSDVECLRLSWGVSCCFSPHGGGGGETDKSSGKWGMGPSLSTLRLPFTNQSVPAYGRPGMGNRSRLKVLGGPRCSLRKTEVGHPKPTLWMGFGSTCPTFQADEFCSPPSPLSSLAWSGNQPLVL